MRKMDTFEKTVSQDYKYRGRIINLRLDKAQLPGGILAGREVVEHPGGVGVAALDENDCLLMVRQFRYPYGRELLEIPAGKREAGEDPLTCGKRELQEETGVIAEEYKELGKLYPSPGYLNEVITLYFAQKLTKTEQHLDENEFLNVERIPFSEVLAMVLRGEIEDAKTQIAVLKLAQMRHDR